MPKTIRIPKPVFVLGDRCDLPAGHTMRPIYGRPGDDGTRLIVGYVDPTAPEFDLIVRLLAKAK